MSPLSVEFLVQLGQLSRRQCDKVLALLSQAAQRAKATDLLEQPAMRHLACPRCRSARYHLHG
jgi:hypothetical protein